MASEKKSKIREWMSVRDLKLKVVAAAVNRSERTIQNWIEGKTVPSIFEAAQLAILFDCKIEALIPKQK